MAHPVRRREFIRSSAVAAAGLAALGVPLIHADPSFDLVIIGGNVLDGTGSAAFSADVGITGDRIAALGRIDPARGRRVIQAAGLNICPGFIDIHTHSDESLLAYPTADSRLLQGVTTELAGNCGGSVAPLAGMDVETRRSQLMDESGIETVWTDLGSYLETVEKRGISINHAMLLGQNTLRQNAIGLADRPLTEDEMQGVLRALEDGLDQGAFGLSTGLEYIPGRYTPTDEILAMARVVARRDGLYATHIRDESAALLESINEALEIGRQAGIRVEISHLKAAGRPNWNKQEAAIRMIESARAAGIGVQADAYPYNAYSTTLTIFMPAWYLEGGDTAALQRLADPAQRKRIREELGREVRNDPGAWDLIQISRVQSDKNRPLLGRNLAEIAETWGVEPVDACLRLLEEEKMRAEMVGFGMKPENVDLVLSNPLVMIGSDGYSITPRGKMAESRPHPRSYGAFARVLSYYARERKIFDLPVAVKKMTSMAADQIGLSDRGRLARGMKADLVIFDYAKVKDTATFQDPQRYPAGVEYVLVNGLPVVEQGKHTGATPGCVLRKT